MDSRSTFLILLDVVDVLGEVFHEGFEGFPDPQEVQRRGTDGFGSTGGSMACPAACKAMREGVPVVPLAVPPRVFVTLLGSPSPCVLPA